MKVNEQKCLQVVLAFEGGFVNHPKDPGGATNKGVTQAVYDAYRRNKGLIIQSVKLIASQELLEIYDKQYWDVVKGDQLPAGLDLVVFDYAVNSGPHQAVKDLQRVVGAPVDGSIGQITLDKVRVAMENDEEATIDGYCQRRINFLKRLKTWGTFGRGWKRRVLGNNELFGERDIGVQDLGIMMARNDLAYPVPRDVLPVSIGTRRGEVAGKGLESDKAMLKNKQGLGAILGASGVTGNSVMAVADQVQPQINETTFGRIALAVFILIMVVGVGLTAWDWYKRMEEKLNAPVEPA